MNNDKMINFIFYLNFLNFVTWSFSSTLALNDTALDEKMAEKNRKFAMGFEEVYFFFEIF